MLTKTWPLSQQALRPGETFLHTWPHTEDMRGADGLGFDVTCQADAPVWLHVTLLPLSSGRPEFIAETSAKVLIPPGTHHAEIPFGLFDHCTLVRAHLRFIHRMRLCVEASAEAALTLHRAGLYRSGDEAVTVAQASLTGRPGETLRYSLTLRNGLDRPRWLTVQAVRDGREALTWDAPDAVELLPLGQAQLTVTARMSPRLPEGGVEEKHFLLTACDSACCDVTLFAARQRTKPCLMLPEARWDDLRRCIEGDSRLRSLLASQYVQPTAEWAVPEPAQSRAFVYPAYSQQALRRAAVAWKLTGDPAFLGKVYAYLSGLVDDHRGYFTTGRTYFQFIENESELDCGAFEEHYGCSAGWVQEGELMTEVALAYDLIRNEGWPDAFHRKMERLMRSYMAFEDWRLLDGDGNNFQIVEASAALLFAFVLQDEGYIRRFLHGTNGLYELLGAVFSDDGSYFEGATGYMRLAAEALGHIAIACEHAGRNLKDVQVPAFADGQVLHSPWALRHQTAADGKPFLGMSFARDAQVAKPTRCLKDCFDQLCRMLTPEGILLSCNDSNEHDLRGTMELGYYLYHDPRCLPFARQVPQPDLLYGLHMAAQPEAGAWRSHLNMGNGFAMLRDAKRGHVQAVLKYGQHGGYHGHFDRLSLLSLIRDGHTFHNMEYAWYGYDSFLFKMWVQTSMAHNMVVVDGRMQEPTPCTCILFEEKADYAAACAQTIARWCDPPYGGQTPYLLKFPEEKCQKEGRCILPPPEPRRQGCIGEYSEPVFQRRLLILCEGVCLVWDVLKADQVHTFDCLYHPLGAMQSDLPAHTAILPRLNDDPYGAGQFVRSCHCFRTENGAWLTFSHEETADDPRSAIGHAAHAALHLAHPQRAEVIIGRYPQSSDTFSSADAALQEELLEGDSKKTVAFRQVGREAAFVTALEIGQAPARLQSLCLEGADRLRLTLQGGTTHIFDVDGMEDAAAAALTIHHQKEENHD